MSVVVRDDLVEMAVGRGYLQVSVSGSEIEIVLGAEEEETSGFFRANHAGDLKQIDLLIANLARLRQMALERVEGT